MRHPTHERRRKIAATILVSLWLSTAIFLGLHVTSTQSHASNILKVGLLQEPKSLNVWLASDAWSRKVLSQVYEPLYVRDPNTLEFVPWLAAEPAVFDEATLSYTVKLRPAKWADGSELTAEDVVFTAEFIQEFKVPRYASKWTFVKSTEALDKHTVKFTLKEPKAIFLDRTLATPIVPKKEWSALAEQARKMEKPLTTLLNHKVESPLGSGPFVLKEWRQGAYLFLEKNPHFFGTGQTINGHKLGPFIDGMIFKIYGTSDAAIMALKKGDIDFFWWGIPSGYMEDLKKSKDIKLYTSEKSALYYMGFNVRKKPFDDIALRQAVATLIDKDFIIERILGGDGIKMHSYVPPGNEFWYCPDVPRYGDGLSRQERVRKAYEMLQKAGYSWETPPVDSSGKVVTGKEIRLPDGKPMEGITILTPPADYDPHRAMCGMIIQEWLKQVGIPAAARPMAFGSLIDQVKVRQEFDAFILGYGSLSLDPDYLRYFFHSRYDKPRGYDMSGYKNPEFEKIADQSAGTMDKDTRRELIWQMQKILMGDVPYIPLYNPNLVEAVRTGTFSGWVQMLNGIGNLWSFCQLQPE
jgi:ABC-type transport system substrate-binding protein